MWLLGKKSKLNEKIKEIPGNAQSNSNKASPINLKIELEESLDKWQELDTEIMDKVDSLVSKKSGIVLNVKKELFTLLQKNKTRSREIQEKKTQIISQQNFLKILQEKIGKDYEQSKGQEKYIVELNQDISKLEDEKGIALYSLEERKKEVQLNRSFLGQQSDKANQLKASFKQIETEIEIETKELEKINKKIQSLDKDNDLIIENINNKKLLLGDQKEEVKTVQNLIEKAHQNKNNIESEINDLDKRLLLLDKELLDKNNENECIEQRIIQLEKNYNEKKLKANSIKSEIEIKKEALLLGKKKEKESTSFLKQKSEEVKTLEESISKVTNNLKKHEVEIEEQSRKLDSLTNTSDENKNTLKDQNDLLKEKQSLLKIKVEEIQKISNNTEAKSGDSLILEEEIKTLDKKIKEQEAHLNKKSDRLQKTNEKNLNLKLKKEGLNKKLKEKQHFLYSTDLDIKKLQNEIGSYDNNLCQINNEIVALTNKISVRTQQLENQQEKNVNKIKSFSKEVEKVKNLRKQLDDLKKESTSTKTESLSPKDFSIFLRKQLSQNFGNQIGTINLTLDNISSYSNGINEKLLETYTTLVGLIDNTNPGNLKFSLSGKEINGKWDGIIQVDSPQVLTSKIIKDGIYKATQEFLSKKENEKTNVFIQYPKKKQNFNKFRLCFEYTVVELIETKINSLNLL